MNCPIPSVPILPCAVLALAAALGAARAEAQVITIDQAKALAGNVTPGDAPGFPVSLGQPGSYRLSGPLTAPDNTIGVIITAPGVTLDLNGFALSGTRCGPVRCQIGGPSYAHGIVASAPGAVAIANGIVDNFVGNGITTYVHTDLLLQGVHLRRHGYCGANANGASVLRAVIAADNGYCGIHAEAGGLMQGISAVDNGVRQVTAANGSLLSSSTLVGPSPQLGGGVTSAGDNLCTVRGSQAVRC